MDEYCHDQVRRHDRARYLTALAAPAPRRPALLALYAFNLEIARTREVVSEPMLGEIRLEWWRESIAGLYAGTPRAHQVVAALGLALQEADLEPGLFETLIEARLDDLYDEHFPTLEALDDYARRSAGALAELAVQALGARDTDSRAAAAHVGTAWALIGLMRALPQHLAARRLYLPVGRLKASGVSPDALYQGDNIDAVRDIVAEIVARARTHLRQAREAGPARPGAALPALLLAPLAEAYARRIEKRGYDCLAQPIALPASYPPALVAWHAWRKRY